MVSIGKSDYLLLVTDIIKTNNGLKVKKNMMKK